jgi:endonuclease-3
MKKTEKIALFLDQFFPHPDIPLEHKDPYTLLIAVLLSAQCTDIRVNRITPSLFQKADTPAKMIALIPGEIEEIIRPCGLAKTKSKAIWNLSKGLIDRHGGKVPETFEELEALSGVGHKTASVVMAQAFNHPAFPVDTHIHRCAARWGLSSGKNVVQTEKDLKRFFPKKHWNKLHLQIIHYARSYCPAKGHEIDKCPICSHLRQGLAKNP